mgnify:CR=1 FL=1
MIYQSHLGNNVQDSWEVWWKSILFILRKVCGRMFYTADVDDIRQKFHQIFNPIKLWNSLLMELIIR